MHRQFLPAREVGQLRETCQRKISASAGRTSALAAFAAPPPGSALPLGLKWLTEPRRSVDKDELVAAAMLGAAIRKANTDVA